MNYIQEFLDSIRQNPHQLPSLDKTMPNYNFRSYLECCNSLNVKPTVTKYVRYNQFWSNHFKSR